jgi:hypothetical protein
MLLGVSIDIWLRPWAAFAAYCSSGGWLAQSRLHLEMMPFSHGGMLLGLLLCFVHRFRSTSFRGAPPLFWLPAQIAQMFAEKSAALLWVGHALPLRTMSATAILMVAMDVLGKSASTWGGHIRRNRKHL